MHYRCRVRLCWKTHPDGGSNIGVELGYTVRQTMAENQSFCVLSSLVFKYSSATPGFIVFFFALITFVKLRAAADKFVYLLLIESWTEKFDRVA